MSPSVPSTHWLRNEAHLVLEGPLSRDICFVIDLVAQEAFGVDEDTDNLTEQDLIDHWPEVDQADRKEITQFVDQEVWQKKSVDELKHSPVDAIWVRTWKWKESATGEKARIVKSRLCARGFLDSQGYMLNTRATTASRLTQR